MLIPICTSGKDVDVLAKKYAKQTELDGWAHNLLILFYVILFSNGFFFILVHDYTLCFIGSPCCSVSYYNYTSMWPYYIGIHGQGHPLTTVMCLLWPSVYAYMVNMSTLISLILEKAKSRAGKHWSQLAIFTLFHLQCACSISCWFHTCEILLVSYISASLCVRKLKE